MTMTLTAPRDTGMSFGKTLAGLREKAGLTQDQLSKKAGVSIDTLRRWEQGRNLPRADDALRLAKGLGVSLDELVLSEDVIDEPPPAPEPKRKPRKKGGE
jgi:transcriptional regulator with XRE-family HTH domain